MALSVLRVDGERVGDAARTSHRHEVPCAHVVLTQDLLEATAEGRRAAQDLDHGGRGLAIDLLHQLSPFRIEVALLVEPAYLEGAVPDAIGERIRALPEANVAARDVEQ